MGANLQLIQRERKSYTTNQKDKRENRLCLIILVPFEAVQYMKKNYKEALITLVGGAGVIPILLAIFVSTIEFGYSIVIAFPFFLIAGVLNGLITETTDSSGSFMLHKSQKEAIITMVGGIGVFVLLIGIFASSVEFGYALVIAYGFFLITGVLSSLIDEKSEPKKKKQFHPPSSLEEGLIKSSPLGSKGGASCSSCGSSMDNDSIFCPQCGKKFLPS